MKLTTWIENLWEPGSEPVFIISGHHNNFNLLMVQCIQLIFPLTYQQQHFDFWEKSFNFEKQDIVYQC